MRTKMQVKPNNSHLLRTFPKGNNEKLWNSNQPDVTVMVIEKEIHLEQSGIPYLYVVPGEGNVVVYGLKLRAITVK
jgi:hypothetical protein